MRWHLLYRIAWRLLNENHDLMAIETDDDIRELAKMRKAVDHDIYQMRAFIRFRRVMTDGTERFVAWYEPDHDTLDANAKFFTDRFGGMRWTILGSQLSLSWDLHALHRGPGVPRSHAPAEDELEGVFRAYYSATYNPARLNICAMKAQLPVRRWKDLPEAQAIAGLVRQSRERVSAMVSAQSGGASTFIPRDAILPVLRKSVGACRACELCSLATQPVFGEGPPDARIVLVGEQPGEEEDYSGRPFVGPAGQILDLALQEAGLDREQCYLTNAVKAFRFEERGKRRIHQTPRGVHIATCRPWLEAEMSLIRPEMIVCLGSTAAQSVTGRSVVIREVRGQFFPHPWADAIAITYHPSAILRAPNESVQRQTKAALIDDLTAAKNRLAAAAALEV